MFVDVLLDSLLQMEACETSPRRFANLWVREWLQGEELSSECKVARISKYQCIRYFFSTELLDTAHGER